MGFGVGGRVGAAGGVRRVQGYVLDDEGVGTYWVAMI